MKESLLNRSRIDETILYQLEAGLMKESLLNRSRIDETILY